MAGSAVKGANSGAGTTTPFSASAMKAEDPVSDLNEAVASFEKANPSKADTTRQAGVEMFKYVTRHTPALCGIEVVRSLSVTQRAEQNLLCKQTQLIG